MATGKFRTIGLACGAICIVGGIITLIMGATAVETNTFFIVEGIFFAALGAIYLALNLKKKP